MKDIQINGAKMNNKVLFDWINTTVDLCKPDRVHICEGSQAENDKLCNQMVASGTFIRLNEEKRPNSFLCRSDPRCLFSQ
jgi:phosphoenolpyruvate carboxykinase (GTP)